MLFSGEDTTSVLNGLTVMGGAGTKLYAPPYGTYVRYGGGILVKDTCGGKFVNNIIRNNTILDNIYETNGGGISFINFNENLGVVIRNNKIFNNRIQSSTYSQGAGIGSAGISGYLIIENNDIYSNTATCTGNWKANGGGISIGHQTPWDTKLLIRNNVIRNNEIKCKAAQGGAIFLTFPSYMGTYKVMRATIEIYNNIIANNSSTDYAGGVAFWDQNTPLSSRVNPFISFYNNTLINNFSTLDGVGLLNYRMRLLLFNNIFKNNLNNNVTEIYQGDLWYSTVPKNQGIIYSKSNFISDNSFGDDSLWGDPMVDTLTYNLMDNSPCIGKGTDTITFAGLLYKAPQYDFAGFYRNRNENKFVDLGAIQYQVPDKVEDILSPNSDLIIYPNPISSTALIQAPNQAIIQRIELIDLTGKVVRLIDQVNSTLVTLERRGLTSGVYILKIHADKVYVSKVIVQ